MASVIGQEEESGLAAPTQQFKGLSQALELGKLCCRSTIYPPDINNRDKPGRWKFRYKEG